MPLTFPDNPACKKNYEPEEKEFRINCRECDGSFTVRTKAVLLRVDLICDDGGTLFEADAAVKEWAEPTAERPRYMRGLWEALNCQDVRGHRLELKCGQCDWSGAMHITAVDMRELGMASHQGGGSFIVRDGL